MHRVALALLPLALWNSAPVSAAEPPLVLWPPEKVIERPYTNETCLKDCHGVPGFAAGGAAGELRNLHVDPLGYVFSVHAQKGVECVDCHRDADPNVHPRTGYPEVDCRACHSETPPPGVYPPDGLARLAEKGIERPPPESRKGDNWVQTKHAKGWLEGKPGAAFCDDCHTAHYVRRSADPLSSVNRCNLGETCGACHEQQVRAFDAGGALARFRIGAHGKGDLSNRYAVTECLACHQGQAAHGEETVTGQACPTCHQVPEALPAVAYASLHIKPLDPDQPLARLLRWAYRAGLWGGVAGAGVLLVFLGFSALYRKGAE